jgi:beta-mannosidase
MEMHQRNYGANGKILSYLSQTYLYPNNIETLLYASQLLQADAIRCGVEHFRRIRGICMGTLYWQLNDCWPGASWSSIDYYGRLKALHYSAKRFFAPIAISCEETSEFTNRFDVTNERNIVFETKAKLFVSNETCNEIVGTIRWQLRNADSKILKSGEKEIVVPQLSVKSISEIDFNKTDVNENYLWYELVVENNVVSYGSVLFTKPKYFNFRDPLLLVSLDDNVITVKSKTYAKYVEIYSSDSDFVLSDNFFDMNEGEKKITVVSGQPKNLKIRSVYDIR